MTSSGSWVSWQRRNTTRLLRLSMNWHRSILPPILQPTTTSLQWKSCRRLRADTVLSAYFMKNLLPALMVAVSITTGQLPPMPVRISFLPVLHRMKTHSSYCSFVLSSRQWTIIRIFSVSLLRLQATIIVSAQTKHLLPLCLSSWVTN